MCTRHRCEKKGSLVCSFFFIIGARLARSGSTSEEWLHQRRVRDIRAFASLLRRGAFTAACRMSWQEAVCFFLSVQQVGITQDVLSPGSATVFVSH